MVDPAVREALGSLLVLDALHVGPTRLGADRIETEYRVVVGDKSASTTLITSWDEPVFDDVEDPAARNLATLIGAQPALNYGLFCRSLVLHGPYDRHDRRLLRHAARNTAREIYVNKLLAPNPFLPGLSLPTVVADDYLLADVRFPDPQRPDPAPAPYNHHPERVAVLSSGGKDSLLSQGLCEEAGYDVHALFVNESGRHWYTALNAWRHLRATRPQRTAKAWTNCDRVFTWMLRRLPFVRPDFARLRADIYPLRLWTVAVFLTSVLPLMRKRGIGTLLVGDEYDTSVRAEHRGISHYAGLYDQSRWFDERFTEYFAAKGWGVRQCSLLRPMSELLIERTLLRRYPELLACQVSCHAARIEGERGRPCGRCEKCRRIVGMLLAGGGDPALLGYDEAAVQRCLLSLSSGGVHQEAEGAAELARELVEVGAIDPDSPFGLSATPHPEVLGLRFDETSPLDVVPVDLRARVLPLMLEEGPAVRRRKGRWEPFDPLVDLPPAEAPIAGHPIRAGQPDYLWGSLTSPQAAERIAACDVALLPVGAVEQHGPHLPLDIDAWDAVYQCEQVARACSAPRPLVLPGIPYGVSYAHADFPGTLSVSPEALARLVHEVGVGAANQGIRKLVIVNGHGGNVPALHYAAQMINRDRAIFVCVDTGDTSDAEVAAITESKNDVHAGEVETSTALATRPELVDMTRAASFEVGFQSRHLDYDSDTAVAWFVRTRRLSPSGVLGDPTRASAEKGRRIWSIIIRSMVELVEHLKATPLDRLYRPGG